VNPEDVTHIRLAAASFALGLLLTGGGAAQTDAIATTMREALAALERGEVRVAKELFTEVVEVNSKHPLANFHLGRLALERGDLAAARDHLLVATAIDYPRVFTAWSLLGRVQLLLHDFETALGSFDGALERAPKFGPARLGRAQALLFLDRVEEGLEELQRVRALPEPLPQAAVLESQLLVLLGSSEEVVPILRAVAGAASEEGERWTREAELLLVALESSAASEQELLLALDRNLSLPGAYVALALSHLESGRVAAADRLFQSALEFDSDNPVTILFLLRIRVDEDSVPLPPPAPYLERALTRAEVLWEQGRTEEAVQIAQRFLTDRPNLVPAWGLIIRDAERRRDLWRAAAGYELLLDRVGALPSLEAGLARVAQTMGAHELALCAVRWALVHAPEDGALLYLQGAILLELGESETAVDSLRQAIEVGYEDVRAWLKLGVLYFEQMQIEESIVAYRRAMEVDPLAAEAVRPFALSSLTTEQYAALRELLKIHVESRPDSIDTLYALGVMSLRENDLAQAKEYLLRLAEIAPDHRQVHYNLGQIYLREGNREAGQAEMERFREIKAAEDQTWERHNQAHFRRLAAREAVAEGEPERAVPLYAESVDDGTAETSDYLELADALHLAGRDREALGWYERLQEWYPYDREVLEGLVTVTEALGLDEPLGRARWQLTVLDWPCSPTVSD